MANDVQSMRFGVGINSASLRDTFKKFMHEFNSALKGADTSGMRASIQKQLDASKKELEKFKQQYEALLSKEVTPKSVTELRKQIEATEKSLEKLSENHQKVVEKAISSVEKEFEKADKEADRLSRKLSDELYAKRDILTAQGNPFPSGKEGEVKINGKYFTNPTTISKLNAVNAQIETLERDLDNAEKYAAELKNNLNLLKVNPSMVPEAQQITAQINEQTINLTELQSQLDSLEANPQLSAEAEALSAKIAETGANVNQLEADLANLDSVGTQTGEAIRGQFEGMGHSLEKLGHRVTGLIKRVFIFSMITKLLRAVRSYISAVAKQTDGLSQSIADLKGNLQVVFHILWETLLPVIKWVINALATLIAYLAKFLSLLTGKSISAAKQAVKSMNAIGAAASGAAEKSMAAFDTVQTLDTSGGGGGAGGGGGELEPSYGALEAGIDSFIQKLMGYLSIAMFAVGVILAFGGINIPLGLALMAAGAALFINGIAPNWNSMEAPVKRAINSLLAIISTASLVLGFVLLFFGATPRAKMLGLGLLFLGAVSLAAMIAINKDDIPNLIEGLVKDIGIIIGAAFLVIGAILVLSPATSALGIALLATGAVALASSAIINSDKVPDDIKKVIATIFMIVSRAFLVVGAILIFSGVSFLIGLALFVAGAAMLIQEAKTNTELVPESVKLAIAKIFKIVAAALLVLGAVLAFSGINILLGLALIAAGAVTLVATQGADWGATLIEKIKSVISIIGTIVGTSLIAVGLILCLTGAGIPVGLAMIFAGAASVYGSLSLSNNPITNFVKGLINSVIKIINWMISQINTLSWDVPDWVPLIGGKRFGFNLRYINYLAKGAVIPPNKEFLAVLGDQKRGTNIEAPLDTIVEAFRKVQGEGTGTGVDIDITFSGSLAKLAEILDMEIQQNRRLKNV